MKDSALFQELYRPLQEGKRFDALLPESFCKATTLRSGDTDITVNHMKKWVESHTHQTVKLANALKQNSLAETIQSIYNFLYHHIQYKADEKLQKLRSSACSWYQRKDGIDCKSFSIFASSLLTNLKIPHYIRKVKQPGYFPDEYTHVYVVVPLNGKSLTNGYYVIDATKHENTEVLFLKSKDTFMSELPHVGLNGAMNHTVHRPLHVSKTAFTGLENFLEMLMLANVSQQTRNAIKAEVLKYTNRGIDPEFKIFSGGVIVNRKLFSYVSNTGLNAPGSGLKSIKKVLEGQQEFGKSYSNRSDSGNGSGDSTTDQSGGEEIEEVASVILESDWFKDTFGQIFANGFNFSCWNSSYSPKKGKRDVAVDMPFILKYSGLESDINTTNLARFLNVAKGYEDDSKAGQNRRFAKCTRQGHRLREEAVVAMIKEVMAQVRENYILTPTLKKKGGFRIPNGLPGYAAGRSYQWGDGYGSRGYTYQGYNVKRKPNATDGGGVSTGGGSTGGHNGGGVIPGGNGDVSTPYNPTNPNNPNNENTAGFGGNKAVAIGIGAVILGTMFMPQIKKAMNTNKNKNKK